MKKTTPKKGIKRKLPKDWKLDELVREYNRLISCGYCRRCKKYVGVGNIESAHMFGRRRKTVRWDLRNVHPLCKNNLLTGEKGCHEIVDNNPIAKASFLHDVLSVEDINELERIGNMTIKEYPIDREKILEELKEKINELHS